MDNIKERVRKQFSRSAASYVTSAIHAKGADLPVLVEQAALTGGERVLDVGTAAGHTAFALAPYANEVCGIDLTPAMLEQARKQAMERRIDNIHFLEGDVEQIPFPDASFDRVTCRLCAHHFPELGRALQEMSRVLKPEGILLLVDNHVPEDRRLDEWINRIEKMRDPSHVRAYSLKDWHSQFQRAGFHAELVLRFATPLMVDDWTKQSRTHPETVAGIKQMLRDAPPEIQEAFEVHAQDPYHFSVWKAVFRATKSITKN